MSNVHRLDPSDPAQRPTIQINRVQTAKFPGNKISTAKYNFVTFVPRFLFEQFRRYANAFFLFIALMQQIPDVSPTALKEMVEDWKRHMSDRKVNRSKVELLQAGRWTYEMWQNLRVGDVVKIVNGQFFPADLILLSSSEPNAMCYIETSNLDGETNLKLRQGISATAGLLSVDELNQFGGEIESEAPNKHLYEFTGNLRPTFSQALPLGPDQLLLRGAMLRNTNWVFGVVVYTGCEAKLILNSTATPLKRSNVERVTNNQILVLCVVLLVVSLISAIASQVWTSQHVEESWYLGISSIRTAEFGYSFLTFIILYNNLIPISLQVTLEVVRFIQAIFINMDLDMYYAPSDMPANARTSNLNEELGQVKYVFSDKTGTLTRNIMTFKRASVAGILYGNNGDEHFEDPTLLQNYNARHATAPLIREFLTLMSVCHTVVPERSAENRNKIAYLASSPDEAALVEGAKRLGFVFHTRTPDAVEVNALGVEERYEILQVLEFTSDRKRQSVIVRTPQGGIKLLTKGADSTIYERLAENQLYADVTLRHLEEFASTGLRTLCLAMTDIPHAEYEAWTKQFYEASTSLHNREQKLSEVAELIEKNLTLIGATAIEDKLQEGVPEAIAALLKADIRVWVLTGDKQETAVNIGYSCRLLSHGMPLLIIDREGYDATRETILRFVEDLGAHIGKENDIALIISGKSLKFALGGDMRREFLELAISCRVVICCRVTPLQKAEVVEMVSKATGAITLAIGDGANDVAMIQSANVGIGISGQEGLQAACAADYAIAQFRYLNKLLFVHGSWSYHRMVKLILYSFHKNICLYIIELWFAIVSAWSGQTVFERWCIGLYNVMFTAAPPLAIGLFDRTASADTMMKFPALYRLSQNRDSFSIRVFWIWISNSMYHSLLLFWLSKLAFSQDVAWMNGRAGGLYMMGNSIYSFVVVTVCLKAGLEVDAWTWLTHLAIWGSIGCWFIFIGIYGSIWPLIPFASEMAGEDQMLFSSGVFWMALFLVPFVTLLFDIIFKIIRRTLFKTIADEVRELELCHIDPTLIIPKLTRRSDGLLDTIVQYDYANGRYESRVTTTEDEFNLLASVLADFNRRSTPTTPLNSPTDESVPFYRALSSSSRLSETARLLRNMFRRSASTVTLDMDARHGYAFSQEEHGVVSQTEFARSYDTHKAKPEGR